MNAVVDSIPGFEFVWQFVTAGAFVGSLLAYKRRKRDPGADPFVLVVRWSCAGLILGLSVLAVAKLRFGL